MFAVDAKKIAEKFTRHGGAFDRGSADSYYHRSPNPHYYESATYVGDAVVAEPGTPEFEAYMAGYEYNEAHGDKKDWG
jgi:hypothetical protein